MAKTLADMATEERADSQIARLQAAVKEMLADINAEAGDELWGFDGYGGQDVVSIEDYGLTQEDME